MGVRLESEDTIWIIYLIGFIEDYERTFITLLGCVLEIINVLTDDVSVGDEVTLTINHV